MESIAISALARRQTEDSEFSHWTCEDSELLDRVQKGMPQAKPGYREGVILVPVDPEGFYSPVVQLQEGDILVGEYRARHPGEDPRKSLKVAREGAEKTPAVGVDVVLYRADVLAEGDERSSDCDWEIIAINARAVEEEHPIHPDTLIANHYLLDGGTATGMTPEEFERSLKVSVLFWRNKGMLATARHRERLATLGGAPKASNALRDLAKRAVATRASDTRSDEEVVEVTASVVMNMGGEPER